MRPLRLLDLFCGAGGAAVGYARAGFEVVGVDVRPQPRYPFAFVQADAFDYLSSRVGTTARFNAIHASPPCQAFSQGQRLQGRGHPDLIGPLRTCLLLAGLPFVIENVERAPLADPVLLCGTMFPELATYRHRLFECSFPVTAPLHGQHFIRQGRMGRPLEAGKWIHAVGNFSDVAAAGKAMGIDWMGRNQLRDAIPPAYTEWIGRQLVAHLERAAA